MATPRTLLVAVAFAAATLCSSVAQAFKDPHNKFCGEDECYAVLGLQRGADKAEIKKAYRTISLDVHPDKNPSAAAKEKFTVRLVWVVGWGICALCHFFFAQVPLGIMYMPGCAA